MPIKLESSWFAVLKDEFDKDYFKNLKQFLVEKKKRGTLVYPKSEDIFRAFELTHFNNVKVVILGQDPYHGENQAHGLSFSVKKGIKTPPSLQNMYKELSEDIEGFTTPNHGDLTHWAQQGVLLLNATLTVSAGKPGSHQKQGWENFTDTIIKTISDKKENVIFILWGKFAQAKVNLIDENKHFIIQSPHPSPFSAHSGFFGSKPFSKTNKILQDLGKQPINWQV